MTRILSTTAVLMALSTSAFADGHAKSMGSVVFEKGDFFASDLIGMRIYNSESEMQTGAKVVEGAEREWDDIGEINDVIVTSQGDVRGVILGVGGFLGMGEKDVAVSMDTIRIVEEQGDPDDRFLVVTTTKEALENAPAFERIDARAHDADVAQTAKATDTADTKEMVQRPALTRPAMQREGYTEADTASVDALRADQIEGSYVYGTNDETVGEIDALILNADGKISEAVINVGGFLGLGEKPVAVQFDRIQVLKGEGDGDFRFYIDSSEEKLEALPEYERNDG